MFDLITGQARHLPRHSALPIAISSATEVVVLTVAVAVPVLLLTERVPEVPTMMAYVAAPPAPSVPAPPPPPAPLAGRKKAPAPSTPVPGELVAPLEAPTQLGAGPDAGEEGFEEGVPGGVEGGVPGGVLGGVPGEALEISLTPPPPPPPAPAPPAGPVRVGGQIAAPTLLHRVEPIYPALAVSAHLEGAVILEATVDANGLVTGVKIVRSAGALLDNAARDAVEQWRYAPLELNGIKTRFLLTVVLRFNLETS